MPTIDELKAQLKELKKTHTEIRYTGLKKAELDALVKKYTEKKVDTPPVKKPADEKKSFEAEKKRNQEEMKRIQEKKKQIQEKKKQIDEELKQIEKEEEQNDKERKRIEKEESKESGYIYLYADEKEYTIWITVEPLTKKSLDAYNLKLVRKKKVKDIEEAWDYISYGEVHTSDEVYYYDRSQTSVKESIKHINSYKDE